MKAQDLSKYQWNNRILIIMSEDISTVEFKKQITALQNHDKALEERKLLILQITPKKYRLGVSETSSWIEGQSELYQKFKTDHKAFETILIGLDGNIKLRQNSLLTSEQLFNTIDAMPMRQSEIRSNKKSKN
ncbi:DUF4174 domain-containing protein [uncultured Psychroserpens sp.]|uniref:DUF4174 domain-containing protein n=1 Tax=uncultured Psychroserpens sp. TaxID=255436 RepID=UPI002628534F|nr:DUF4174 domain-containing protein [uncultured Psychroserpens sp.]